MTTFPSGSCVWTLAFQLVVLVWGEIKEALGGVALLEEVHCQDEAFRVSNLAPLPVGTLGFHRAAYCLGHPAFMDFLWNREHV